MSGPARNQSRWTNETRCRSSDRKIQEESRRNMWDRIRPVAVLVVIRQTRPKLVIRWTTVLLLTSVDTEDEANELTRRFEASGIPIFVEPDYSRSGPQTAIRALGTVSTSGWRSS